MEVREGASGETVGFLEFGETVGFLDFLEREGASGETVGFLEFGETVGFLEIKDLLLVYRNCIYELFHSTEI
jgi:hypothetical protein